MSRRIDVALARRAFDARPRGQAMILTSIAPACPVGDRGAGGRRRQSVYHQPANAERGRRDGDRRRRCDCHRASRRRGGFAREIQRPAKRLSGRLDEHYQQQLGLGGGVQSPDIRDVSGALQRGSGGGFADPAHVLHACSSFDRLAEGFENGEAGH
jgi:hypothetical protein